MLNHKEYKRVTDQKELPNSGISIFINIAIIGAVAYCIIKELCNNPNNSSSGDIGSFGGSEDW